MHTHTHYTIHLQMTLPPSPQQSSAATLATALGLTQHQHRSITHTWPNLYATGGITVGSTIVNALCGSSSIARQLFNDVTCLYQMYLLYAIVCSLRVAKQAVLVLSPVNQIVVACALITPSTYWIQSIWSSKGWLYPLITHQLCSTILVRHINICDNMHSVVCCGMNLVSVSRVS
jgi:hypothetical protein